MKKSEIKKRVAYFKSEVYHWQKVLGLMNWEIGVFPILKENGARGDCRWSEPNRLATIRYCPEWIAEEGREFKEISKVAFHECMEVVMANISEYLDYSISRDLRDQAVHDIIRLTENLMFKNLYKEK